MSELFEFISIEYSFREINFRGIQLLGVSQEHNFHRPVSRLLALRMCIFPVFQFRLYSQNVYTPK
jgi:hypothetical protein